MQVQRGIGGLVVPRLVDLDDDEVDPDETLDIDVDVNNSAAANARWFYQVSYRLSLFLISTSFLSFCAVT